MINLLKTYFFELITVFIITIMYKDSMPFWAKEWINFDSFYGLGFFVIGFNVYYIKNNFQVLKELQQKSNLAGIFVVFAAVLSYIIGIRASMDYMIALSLPLLAAGVVLSFYGVEFLKKLLLPLLLSGLILPIFPLHRLTMPLQMLSTTISADVLKFLGLNAFNEGNILFVNKLRLAIVAGCSGLKSLSSLIFVSIIASYLEQSSLNKRLFYVFLTIPLAIVMNVIRIVITAFYGLYNGHSGLEQFHDNVGLVVNLISIGIMIFIIRAGQKQEETL